MPRSAAASGPEPAGLVRLQRRAGNRAVGAALAGTRRTVQRLKGGADAEQRFKDASDAHIRGLDEPATQGLRAYSGPLFGQMNNHLRGRSNGRAPGKQVLDAIRDASGAVSRMTPLEEPITVSRATSHLAWSDAEAGRLVGTVLREPGFLSTSLGDEPVIDWTNMSVYENILHLRAPAGARALWMASASSAKGREKEVLFAPGTRYRIDRVEHRKGRFDRRTGKHETQYHFHGEILA